MCQLTALQEARNHMTLDELAAILDLILDFTKTLEKPKKKGGENTFFLFPPVLPQ